MRDVVFLLSMNVGTAILKFFLLLVHWYMKDAHCTYCDVWVYEWVISNGKNIPICPDCMVAFYYCPRCYKSIIESGENTAGGICHECRDDAIWYVHEKHDPEQTWEDED